MGLCKGFLWILRKRDRSGVRLTVPETLGWFRQIAGAALSRNGASKWGLSFILAILCYLVCSTIYACAIVALYAPLIPKLQLTDVFRFIYFDILFFLLQFIEIAVLVPLCRRFRAEKTALAE